MTKLEKLIQESKGRFFSITFQKKDGTVRTINGKNRYRRLLANSTNPQASNARKALKQLGYVSAVNRNTETWFNAHTDKVIAFDCGSVHETFQV